MNQIKIDGIDINRDGEYVSVGFDIKLEGLKIRSNDVILLTPALRKRGSNEVIAVLPGIEVSGRTRRLVLDRMDDTGLSREWSVDRENRHTRKNGSRQTISYIHRMPYESYMSDAELIITEVVHGCADCMVGDATRVLRSPFVEDPALSLTYITPEVEPVKARSDRHSATFNFVVAKHDLLRDYKNNAAEFARVDKVISEVMNNKDLTITEFVIEGYASPEDDFERNRALAGRRARAFADYLVSTHGVKRSQFRVTGHGEDWEGLKAAVTKSSLPTKSQVLDIIANTPNADARDAKIMAIDGGKTYNDLLTNYYPPLRRTDYVIAYNVRAFSVEEAREIIKTNPKLLSLNEMYLVAKSYPSDSKEFKEVFDIASRLYPNEPIAIINASAADIEGGNYQAAIERLRKLENNGAALNNMGVAYAKLRDRDTAIEMFERAIAAGERDHAANNLNELTK